MNRNGRQIVIKLCQTVKTMLSFGALFYFRLNSYTPKHNSANPDYSYLEHKFYNNPFGGRLINSSPQPIILISPSRNNPSRGKAAPLMARPGAVKGHFSGTLRPRGSRGGSARGQLREVGQPSPYRPSARSLPPDGGRSGVTARTETPVTPADMVQTSDGRETAEEKDAVTGGV